MLIVASFVVSAFFLSFNANRNRPASAILLLVVCVQIRVAHGCGIVLIVKGVLSGEDAARVARLGADGVIVSNHGGRQLDGTDGAIEHVAECVSAVAATGAACDVMFDSGELANTMSTCMMAVSIAT